MSTSPVQDASPGPDGTGSAPAQPVPDQPVPDQPVPDQREAAGHRTPLRRAAGWFRQHRVVILLILLLCGMVALSLWGRTDADGVALSPDNPAPDGGMAAAQILSGQGVEVLQPQDIDEAQTALEEHPGATLLYLDPNGFLDNSQMEELAGAAGRTVLVAPTFAQLAAIAPDIRQAGLLPADPGQHILESGCRNEDALAAGSVATGGRTYRGPVTCFPFTEGGESDAGEAAGSYAATRDGSTVVLGSPDLIANKALASEGNAALALRTLGPDETLVWYRAVPADIPVTDQPADPFAYLPAWVGPLMLWLVLVTALAGFWRGRRLGPLAEEPLPVVVRSAETAEGRARLYQDSQAVDHAAATLRAAAMTRLAAHLRLGPGAGTEAVTRATAEATGRSYAETDILLNQQRPGTGSELVRWAQDLHDLEEEATSS